MRLKPTASGRGNIRTSPSPMRQRPERYREEGVDGRSWLPPFCWTVPVDDPPLITDFHHVGSRKIAINMLLPIPTAHTWPRLAIPALLDHASDPNPAMAVPPHKSKARPTDW